MKLVALRLLLTLRGHTKKPYSSFSDNSLVFVRSFWLFVAVVVAIGCYLLLLAIDCCCCYLLLFGFWLFVAVVVVVAIVVVFCITCSFACIENFRCHNVFDDFNMVHSTSVGFFVVNCHKTCLLH